MDPIYMRGLRDAKALLDEGVLSAEEFTAEKEELLRLRNARMVLAARGGEGVEDTVEAHVADGAVVTHSLETGGDDDNDDEAERPSPFLHVSSVASLASTLEVKDDAVTVPSGVQSLTLMLTRVIATTCADPQAVPTFEGKTASEAAKDWHAVCEHNALAELRAVSEKDSAGLPTICVTLQSHISENEIVAKIHSGAKITAVHSYDDSNFSDLSGCAGHLLEEAGNLFIALMPAQADKGKNFLRPKRSMNLRWCDLVENLPCEVRYEGAWYQAVVVRQEGDGCDRVAVEYAGYGEEENYEEIDKDSWKVRIRAPSPALHLYGLSPIKMASEGDGIRTEIRRTFKSYGYVGDVFNVIEAVILVRSHALAEDDASGDGAGKGRLITQSIAKLQERKPAFALRDMVRYGPHPRTSASSASGTDVYQHEAISSIHYDVEAIQGPPGTGKSSMISTILSDYLPDHCTLVTCVQNKAVCALVEKLAGTAVPFIVTGGRCTETQAQLATRVLPLTLRYTAWGHALRAARVRPYTIAKVCSQLVRLFDQDSAIKAEQRRRRAVRQASRDNQTLEMMGMMEPGQDSWQHVLVQAKWLRVLNKLRFGAKVKARASSWPALTDSVLHREAVESMVRPAEKRAMVFLSTVDSTHKVQKTLGRHRRHLDVVIVDEAGCVPEWKMPLLTRFNPSLLLMVGDHKQLPPYTTCKDYQAVSVLQRLANALALTQPIKMLQTQYRMHPDIADIVSHHFYGNLLQTDTRTCAARQHSVRARAAAGEIGGAIVWHSHSGQESTEEKSFSTVNLEEVRIISQDIIPALAAGNKGQKVTVITFYKAQQRLLQEQLGAAATVMTVDSAQGSESDVVILSCVRSNTEKKIGHVRDARRINVALSRAKVKLIVVGNASCFQHHVVWRDLWHRAFQVKIAAPS